LKQGMRGTGYLSDHNQNQEEGVPNVAEGDLKEELWYSCKFWIDHLVKVKTPTQGLVAALQTFLLNKAVLWMEILGSRGLVRGVAEVQQWSKVRGFCLMVGLYLIGVFSLRGCQWTQEFQPQISTGLWQDHI
jgi:hypothetical protein